MEESISAAEANRNFSSILRGVRAGHSYVVTAHGKPLAKITPFDKYDAVRTRAKTVLFARLRSHAVIDIGPWTREELYEDSL